MTTLPVVTTVYIIAIYVPFVKSPRSNLAKILTFVP